MNEKWFDECSVVAYPHEIRFLNVDGGSMSYCVDRHVSEYVGKIQAQLNTLQNENCDKDIKNMILQSKIDKVNRILNANTHIENIYHALCNLFDKEYQYEIDNEELNKILKEVENGN